MAPAKGNRWRPDFYFLELTKEQFDFIKNYRANNPTRGWPKIYKQFYKHFSDLKTQVDQPTLQTAYKSAKADLSFMTSPNYCEHWEFCTDGCSDAQMSSINTNPNSYYYRHPIPGLKKLTGPFSRQETKAFKKFISILHEEPKWGNMATFFPGRCGYQLQNFYQLLLKRHEIEPITIQKKQYGFFCCDHKALSPQQKELLAQYIRTRFNNHERTTMKMVSEKATEIYYQAEPLAHKAALHHFKKEKIQYKEEDGSFTQEFNDYQNVAAAVYDRDPSEFFTTYKVAEFKASYAWVSIFLKQNHFSIRHAHRKRRNAVDSEEVETYLQELREAIQKYGEEFVFNMDETSVFVNNTPPDTIAPTGSQEVVINIHSNEKECFTALGTCTKLRTYPLIILAKGTTDRCESKFGRNQSCFFFHNTSGWTNESTMKQYLAWLQGQAGGNPCALIIDSFKAHISLTVQEYAETLQIQLIKVPANGTGTYQPLDRKVFGVVKRKLRSMDTNFPDSEERFLNVTDHLLQAWRAVSEKCLASAWAIPGLEETFDDNDEVEPINES